MRYVVLFLIGTAYGFVREGWRRHKAWLAEPKPFPRTY